MPRIRHCKGCTRLFEPKLDSQRYHNLRCSNRARQRRKHAKAKIRKALGKG